MSEPQRLKDKYAGRLEGTLLRSAHVDAPSSRNRGRALVALGVGTAVAGAPAATTAAATVVGASGAKTLASVGLLAAVKWGTIGIVVGALTIGGMHEAPKLFAARSEAPASAPASPVATEVAPRSSHEPELASDLEPEPMLLDVPAPAPAPHTSPRSDFPVVARVPSTAPGSSAAPMEALGESGLAEEVAALDRARRAAATDPEGALRMLDEYERRFPSGDLAPEALVVRIEALVRGGERARGEALAQSYLTSHPRSPHAKRIRTILGWSDDAR